VAREVDTDQVSVVVNGTTAHVRRSDRYLADHLRNGLGLKSVKIACDRGECGSCTVLHGDDPVASCVMPVELVDLPVTTLEAVVEETRAMRSLMADLGAFQCGFCTPGQVMNAVSILRRRPVVDTDEDSVRSLLSGNICRCTGYVGLVNSILTALGDPVVHGAGRR
jgi:aerobic-type carbon monoxide dehydrogenase small subunit (CoxS/CutS family)